MRKYYLSFSHFVLLVMGAFYAFSGLIKLNDPVGFALKIEAYLRAFGKDFHQLFLQFLPYALPMAVTVCMLEVLLGMALVLRIQVRLTLLALVGLTVFFALLTLYTLYFKRMDSCGCLSEAIPLNPLHSFLKNILLLFILAWLIKKKRLPASLRSSFTQVGLLSLVVIGSLYLGWYAFRNLPIIDFGRYKPGTHIPALIQPKNPLRYQYWLEKEGETTVSETYPTDATFRLIKTELLNPTDQPLVTNFTIWSEDREITEELLHGNKLICIVKHAEQMTPLIYASLQAYVQQSPTSLEMLILLPFHESKEGLPCDARRQARWGSADLLQSMIRGNMGFILLQQGTVKEKWSDNALLSLYKKLQQLT